jgi:hypothetical protein
MKETWYARNELEPSGPDITYLLELEMVQSFIASLKV